MNSVTQKKKNMKLKRFPDKFLNNWKHLTFILMKKNIN